LERPKDHNDVIKMAQDPKIISITEAHKELLDEVNDLYSYLDKISKDFENIDYKAEHTQKGAVVSLLDSIPFLHGSGKGSLLADDFDRVINAITPFRTGVKRLMDSLNGADDVVKKSQEEIAASLAKTKSELSPASQTSVNNGKTVEDLDKEHADLSSSLTSGLSGIIPGI
jgi:predicted  nucleic acid-binding Zn-ribbon protein